MFENTGTGLYLLHSWTNEARVTTSDGSTTTATPVSIPTNACGTTSPQVDGGFSDICWNKVGGDAMPASYTLAEKTITFYRYQAQGGKQPYYEVGSTEKVWALVTLEDSAIHKLSSVTFKEAVQTFVAAYSFSLISAHVL